jgi:FkbM family methyltransferase
VSLLQGLRSCYHLFGFHGIFLTAKARASRKPVEIQFALPICKYPLHLRLRTSDVSLLSSILLHSEYNLELSEPPLFIVDAGANIGFAAVFFANKYPEAKILAIEPESSNYEVLKRNVAPYPNIQAIRGALWNENTHVTIVDPGSGNWGFQTCKESDGATEPGQIRAFTLDKAMSDFGFEHIDLLKIDVEGAEKEVFENPAAWLNKVRVIAVELHDHLKNGCSRSVYVATRDFEHEWRLGETIFLARANTVAESQTPEQKIGQLRIRPGRLAIKLPLEITE